MFQDTTTHTLRHTSLLTIASEPWQMFTSLLARRRAFAQLSKLSDRMLEDIGISRGDIRSAIRSGRPH